jgi:hypothetical protein
MKLPAGERQARLIEGSKKESGLVWYSSTTAEDALALTKRFNEQHPSIQIQHLRSSSEKLLERILAESRANAFKADIVALPELELSIMIKRKLLARYEGLENSIYPAETKDPGGYWTGLYTSAWVAAYNTKMVNKDAAPKTYKDLLNPKWKGSIAMDTEPYNWFVVSLRFLERRDGREAGLHEKTRGSADPMAQRPFANRPTDGGGRISHRFRASGTHRRARQGPGRAGGMVGSGWRDSNLEGGCGNHQHGRERLYCGVVLRFSFVPHRNGNNPSQPPNSDPAGCNRNVFKAV